MLKPLVLLDLDHTLVHVKSELVHPGFVVFPLVMQGKFYYVHVRPFALELLQYLLGKNDVLRFGFWSAGTRQYIRSIVSGLFGILNVRDWQTRIAVMFSRASAMLLRNGLYVKELTRVDAIPGVGAVILIDDDRVHRMAKCNKGRIVTVPRFDACKKSMKDEYLQDIQSDLTDCLAITRSDWNLGGEYIGLTEMNPKMLKCKDGDNIVAAKKMSI